LKFYAPKSLGKDIAKVLVYLVPEPGCEKCTTAAPGLQNLVKSRLEHRGLTPVMVTPGSADEEALVSSRTKGHALDEKVSDLATSRKLAGAYVVQWRFAPVDSIDSAHADEKHYVLHHFLFLRGFSQTEGNMDLLDNDSFELSTGRLLSDAFSEFGTNASLVAATVATGDEILLEVSGIRSFEDYTKAKAFLESKLSGTQSLEDRMITRGKVTFVVFAQPPLDKVRNQLSALNLDSVGGEGGSLHLEVK
jgi:hypothetical protein